MPLPVMTGLGKHRTYNTPTYQIVRSPGGLKKGRKERIRIKVVRPKRKNMGNSLRLLLSIISAILLSTMFTSTTAHVDFVTLSRADPCTCQVQLATTTGNLYPLPCKVGYRSDVKWLTLSCTAQNYCRPATATPVLLHPPQIS